jgi:hypothetical protein
MRLYKKQGMSTQTGNSNQACYHQLVSVSNADHIMSTWQQLLREGSIMHFSSVMSFCYCVHIAVDMSFESAWSCMYTCKLDAGCTILAINAAFWARMALLLCWYWCGILIPRVTNTRVNKFSATMNVICLVNLRVQHIWPVLLHWILPNSARASQNLVLIQCISYTNTQITNT